MLGSELFFRTPRVSQLALADVRVPGCFLICLMVFGLPAIAGPPYRTGDADSAEEGTLGVRVGILRVQREASSTDYLAPLLRLKLALTPGAELASLLDYSPENTQLRDGGLAFKLVSREDGYNIGTETVLMLPVSPHQSGVGFESHVLATIERPPFRVHLDVGGFYDPRLAAIARGWRAGMVGERKHGQLRTGLELYVRKAADEHLQVQAGLGFVAPAGPVKLRAGMHVGLTSAAPDLAASIWVTGDTRLW